MTNAAPEKRNYLSIDSIGNSIANRLGADKTQKNFLTRTECLWHYYKLIINWKISDNHLWLLGGNQNLITYTQNLFTGSLKKNINTNTGNISFNNVTGYVYLARLLVQYPSFKKYLTTYVAKAANTQAPAPEKGQDSEDAAPDPMPDLYFELWERTGDEPYLLYLQSVLYVLNRLGSANLKNDRDNLEPDKMDKSGKQQTDTQYYDNVVAYCLLVIDKFENPDFVLNRRYKLNRKLKLNIGFGKYRDKYLKYYGELQKLEAQTLGLIGLLNSPLHLTRWQIGRLSALAKKYSTISNKINKKLTKVKGYTEDDRRLELMEDIEHDMQTYAKLFETTPQLTEEEYSKLKALSEQVSQLLATVRTEDPDT